MAGSTKMLTLENNAGNGEWTAVLPCRGKKRRNFSKSNPEKKQQEWAPTDLESNPCRESKLTEKMQICIKKVESSQFYQNLLEQILTPEILNCFHRVLGLELKMPMVMHVIGSIESYETPRVQLSVAIRKSSVVLGKSRFLIQFFLQQNIKFWNP